MIHIIFSDNQNIIHIASVSDCKLFEKIDIRENKWNIYINNQSFDDIFALKIQQNDYHARLLLPNSTN